MYDSIKFNSNSPIYLQICKYFEALVFVNKLSPGELIPSRRELAAEMRVNLNTVQKAYSYMEEIGLIKTEKNKFSVITDDIDKINTLKEEYIREPLIEFIGMMKKIDISKDKIISLIDFYYDKVDEELDGEDNDSTEEYN